MKTLKLLRFSSLTVALALLISSPLVYAKQYTERQLRDLGIQFLMNGGSDISSAVSGTAAGSGKCFDLPLPQVNDQAALAKAIDDYIRAAKPSSPFIGLGADIVSGAVRNGVNPLYIVGNLRMESSYGTSGMGGGTSIAELLHQHFNAFGRTASSSQPNFLDRNGRRWYAYTSWKVSVNSPDSSPTKTTDQPSLMRKVYLDDGIVTLEQYLNRYAPPTDGNDTSAYGRTVTDTIQEIITLAGSALGCEDNSTDLTPATQSGKPAPADDGSGAIE